MELNQKQQRLNPQPRRGQIKMKILKSLINSAAELVNMASGSKNKKGSAISLISSNGRKNPGETPSCYDSGTDSDGSYR
ncbi:hypothetical protein A4A49_02837 [Nicotiana attenuata]|uniref:Uncharacterized protein n=1 Tax=Nicotiana attenuata TaxID=49451 RepID=A0A1J6ID30_NICAT|nr:hypothetical protein A4A49_02837 [Nicotiana attenuata]